MNLILTLPCISLLAVAAYLDVKHRKVPNKVWVILFLVTLPFFTTKFLWMIPLILIAYLLGFFAAADAKCLIVLSFTNNVLVILLGAWLLFPVFLPVRKIGGHETYPFILPILASFLASTFLFSLMAEL